MCHRRVDVVVAEDNTVLLNVLSEILGECGYAVRSASDGLEALTEIRSRVPDILLSDLNMPRMSGFELLSIVRRRYPTVKVIAMSGSDPRGVVPQGVAADAFYKKSEMGIAQLLLIVNGMKDEPESRLLRVSAPIWLPKPLADASGESSVPFACPECLRAYTSAIIETDSVCHRKCPHCLFPIQLRVCPAEIEVDSHPLIYYYS